MKHLLSLLLILLLPLYAAAETTAGEAPVIIDRTGNLTEEYHFPEGTPILEIVFPRVYSSDCAIVRYGYDTMMIDASLASEEMQDRIRSALQSMGVTYIDVAFNSHPHDDHINGFIPVAERFPVGRLVLTFEEDYNENTIRVTDYYNAHDIPIEHVGDGDVFYMGPEEDVEIRVLQRNDSGTWEANNRSAMLHIRFGERSILFSGDVENHAQRSFGENPPEGGLKADILKYPHHGQVKLHDPFFDAIGPELVFMNGADQVMTGGKNYLDKRKTPYLIGYTGLTRLRTDGKVWVVDYMHEIYTDRNTKNPEYQ
ncbi:MAG: MBL fold metallo-hydrolase [Clostridia bacterium]|nr:MBL fold metallo-hydrolase [Clostridia bacterium]